MSLITSLLGSLWPYLAAAGGALLVLWRVWAGAHKAGVNQQIAKEAKARDENLKRIKAAADAGAAVRPDDPGVQHDPHDLD